MNLYLITGVIFLITSTFILIYKLGKSVKEKEIINTNNELKKTYNKKKYNSINDVFKK